MRTHDDTHAIPTDDGAPANGAASTLTGPEQADTVPPPTVTTGNGAPASSRRRFLGLGAATAAGAVAAAVTAPRDALAQRPRTAQPRSFPTTPAGTTAQPMSDWRDPILRLVRRTTMGVSADEVALARQLGYAGYLEYQLDPAAIDDSAIDTLVGSRLPMTLMDAVMLSTQDSGEVTNQLQDAALYRAAFSKRQLKERMIEFWTDHFTVSVNKVGYLKMVDDRDVIRRHAMTSFPALLRATSESGAMLAYLDQNRSRTPTPNQNYAREIMELHTLGVDGGYTQNDVAELSRILTGWSTGTAGVFAYNTTFHDRGAKTFLGRAFPATPATTSAVLQKKEGDDAITMLLEHPSTAQYVSLKMARWLLAYEPPQAVVDAAAAAYTRTNGNIPAMIRAILTGQNLIASPAKYKRPFHYAASALRALSANVVNIRALRQQADRMGQPMYMWEQPNGYPDRVDWWSGLVLNRWSFASYIAALTSTTAVAIPTTAYGAPTAADAVIAQIGARVYGGEFPETLKTQLTTYLKGGTLNDARLRETLALAISAHHFQWY